MKTFNIKNKKIGIWGFGVVGKSVLKFVKQQTNHISIMDLHDAPTDFDLQNISWIKQTPENIIKFLTNHDLIIPSPGIVLHDYQTFAHKFIQELDLFATHNTNPCIAITGTVGKTTVTSMIAQCIPGTIAAGNIGHAMLDTIEKKQTIILELSSYQLHYAQNFAPDLAIWTNFYPNHLDHHQDEAEYFAAKCNLLTQQRDDQKALLPCHLIEKIKAQTKVNAQIYLFCETNCTHEYPTFVIKDNQLILQHKTESTIIFNNFDQLPKITFAPNWIVISGALHLQSFTQAQMIEQIQKLQPEPHRLEFVTTLHNVKIYNDSKSTIWQATKQAIDQFDNQRIALFLGGISKGTDRTPLIEYLKNKNVTVFNFGKEAQTLAQMCAQNNVSCYTACTLPEALDQCLTKKNDFEILLFSPAGASFDLFKNYQDRGDQFKKMIHAIA